jgi:hypothetical protein
MRPIFISSIFLNLLILGVGLAADPDTGIDSDAELVLGELRTALPRLIAGYESLSATVTATTTAWPLGSERVETMTRIVLVAQRERDYFLVDSKCKTGGGFNGVFLVNPRDGWTLSRDKKSGQLFLSQQGKKLTSKDYRQEEWWIEAAYSFGIRRLDGEFLKDDKRRTISKVRRFTDETGEQIVEIESIRIPKHRKPGDEGHNAPMSQFQFYRDRHWALKSATDENFLVGTDQQLRKYQLCSYEPWDGALPKLRRVILESSSRSLSDKSDKSKWRVFEQQVAEFTELSFQPPEIGRFEINRLLPEYGRKAPPSSNSAKWFFLVNGIICLSLWFCFRRRNRKTMAAVHD